MKRTKQIIRYMQNADRASVPACLPCTALMVVRGHIWILHLTAGDCRLWLCCRFLASLLIVARDRHKKDFIQMSIYHIPQVSLERWKTTALSWRGDQPRYKILLLLLASVGSVAWWRTAGPLATGMEGDGEDRGRTAVTTPAPRTCGATEEGGDLSSIIQIQGSYNWCLEYHSYLLTV